MTKETQKDPGVLRRSDHYPKLSESLITKPRCEDACRYGLGCKNPAKWAVRSWTGGTLKVCGTHKHRYEHARNIPVRL